MRYALAVGYWRGLEKRAVIQLAPMLGAGARMMATSLISGGMQKTVKALQAPKLPSTKAPFTPLPMPQLNLSPYGR